MVKEGKIRENLHPRMDGEQTETHIGALDSVTQDPNEEQKEEEHEKGNQDHEGCDHPLIQGD